MRWAASPTSWPSTATRRLVGLAPLYHRTLRRTGLVRARSVQMIGIAWRDPEPLISEYLDVIAPRRGPRRGA